MAGVQDALEQHKFEAPTAPSRKQPEAHHLEAETIATKTAQPEILRVKT
jgi:hypothetical protein